jgi:hypothetical protein
MVGPQQRAMDVAHVRAELFQLDRGGAKAVLAVAR